VLLGRVTINNTALNYSREAMTQFSTSSLLLCILLRQSHVAQASSDGDTPQNWYTKYDSYPQYCSTPDEMDARSIPPLQNDYSYGETRLLHVTALIRHGARTPWASNEDCFPVSARQLFA
jgi:ubiquitin-like domain-containing CTD phosphatase 1